MATYAWTLQGSTPTTITPGTHYLQFAAATFDSAITVNAYNDTTHVEAISGGTNVSSGNTPNNNKFISQTGGTGGDSQADWGGGTEDLDQILDAECTLKLNFSHGSSVAVTGHIVYAYDGTTTTAVPTEVDCRIAEKGDANWTEAEGSAAACTITDEAAATSHDYYIAISASPTAVGEKTAFKIRSELTYS